MDQTDEKLDDEISKELKEGMSKSASKYIIAIVVFLMMLAIWISKTSEVEEVREEAAKHDQLLKGEATMHVVHSHEEHLRLLAKPFVWAIRAELMQNNLKQIKLYMNEMVEKTNFQHIAVVDNKGKIIVSTDKNDEGKPFATIGRRADLLRPEVRLENVSNKTLIMTSPITSPDGRLGTLVIRYNIQPITFK